MIKINTKIRKTLFATSLLLVVATGIAFAAFGDTAKYVGSSFKIGSADLKLLINLGSGTEVTNLADELPGPNFDNIGPNWTSDYPIKLYNNGTSDVQIMTNAFYETVNDPDDLRQDIMIELFAWDDVNQDGIVDISELGVSLGQKTIIKWKTEGYAVGTLGTNNTMGLLLRFSTLALPDTKQGSSAIFDFEFDSIGL